MVGKYIDSLEEKMFRAQRSVNKVMPILFHDMKGLALIDYLEKVATVSNSSYCLILYAKVTWFIVWLSYWYT